MIPVRCYTCGAPVCIFWEPYKDLRHEGLNETDALNQVEVSGRKLTRPCCRVMISGFIDTDDAIIQKALVKKYMDSVSSLANKMCALDVEDK